MSVPSVVSEHFFCGFSWYVVRSGSQLLNETTTCRGFIRTIAPRVYMHMIDWPMTRDGFVASKNLACGLFSGIPEFKAHLDGVAIVEFLSPITLLVKVRCLFDARTNQRQISGNLVQSSPCSLSNAKHLREIRKSAWSTTSSSWYFHPSSGLILNASATKDNCQNRGERYKGESFFILDRHQLCQLQDDVGSRSWNRSCTTMSLPTNSSVP